jgi:D-alanyl-D-alanine dipeptidase
MNDGFVFVDEVVPGLRWDAKYATWDNFTGAPVDGYEVNRIAGTRELADALVRAQTRAGERGFGLVLWDGYRPQRATERFRRWATEPEDGARKERHYPRLERPDLFARGYVHECSGHSRGSTVDLTLYRLDTGELAAMGGDHDLMDEISHHAAPGIRDEERANRRRLRALMEESGFVAYESEWWHYTLAGEPYPDRYFDFPVANG